jgi:hypothetical protein
MVIYTWLLWVSLGAFLLVGLAVGYYFSYFFHDVCPWCRLPRNLEDNRRAGVGKE